MKSIQFKSQLAITIVATSILILPSLLQAQRIRRGVTNQNGPRLTTGSQQSTRSTPPPTSAQSRRPQGQNSELIQTVAIVNGQQITRQKLATQTVRRYGDQVIESVISKQLILNQLNKQNIVITEKDVNDEIKRQATKLKTTVEHYLQVIQSKRNISVDRIKNDIFWTELALRRLAAEKIQVSPQEIAREMETEFGEKVLVRAIALKDLQTANQVMAGIRANPEDFGQLAIKHSIDRDSASRRGLLPPIRRHTGDPKLENVAFSLKPGEVSNLIEMGDPQTADQGAPREYIILKCDRKYPAVQLAADQKILAQERIIEQIRNAKMKTAATDLLKNLQKNVKVVNVYNDEKLRQQMPGVAAMVDGKSITMRYLSEECIARYGIEILETEITLLLLRQALQKQGLSVSDQDVTAEIMRAANSFGFAKDGKIDMNAWLDYITQGDQSKIAFYIEDEVWPTVALKKIVGPTVQVTQEDMRKGFIANFGERVEVQAIILHDIKLAKKVWQQATADPSEKFFGQLAAEYSMDVASKNNKGHINPIPQYGGIPELEKEAFRLKKPGDISAIIQVGQNFAILRYLGRTKPVVQDFDAVKADLQADILEKKTRVAMNDYFGRLRSSAQIDNFMTGTSQTGRQAVGDSRQPQAGQPRLK